MKSLILLPFLLSILFFNCKNASKVSEKKNIPTQISKSTSDTKSEKDASTSKTNSNNSTSSPERILIPSEDENVDFWTANNCTLGIPEQIIPEEKRPEYYSFKVNKKLGFFKEILSIKKGYKLDITQKGCDSYSLIFSYFFRIKELDINDQNAVSEKVLELMELTAKICEAPYNFKSRIPALRQAVEEIGPFQVGEEMVLSNDEIGESFMLEYLQERNGKIFLSYNFSMGPL